MSEVTVAFVYPVEHKVLVGMGARVKEAADMAQEEGSGEDLWVLKSKASIYIVLDKDTPCNTVGSLVFGVKGCSGKCRCFKVSIGSRSPD